jgi:hypothetical protein
MELTSDGGVRWQEIEEAARRYDDLGDGIVGLDEWRQLVGATREAEPNELRGVLVDFLDETAQYRRGLRPTARLFISHQRNDKAFAERIAWLARRQSVAYWLDAHDPLLRWANDQNTITGAQLSVLIAGIIEMGLLNCTSVIAVHSTNSPASKWIPYELGRAKLHVPLTDDAAGWFHPDVQGAVAADYFELARKTYGEGAAPNETPLWNPWIAVDGWLSGRTKSTVGLWSGREPDKLP